MSLTCYITVSLRIHRTRVRFRLQPFFREQSIIITGGLYKNSKFLYKRKGRIIETSPKLALFKCNEILAEAFVT